MTTDELAQQLRDAYERAPKGDKVVSDLPPAGPSIIMRAQGFGS